LILKNPLVGLVIGLAVGLVIGIVVGLLLEADCTVVCI
jgi:ABC-type nitrate/sulfonate/bicarbonate transport system permease component